MNVKQFKSLYDSLPKEIFCRSLNRSIYITRSGYKHVFEGKIRNFDDIKTRAKVITYIPTLITTINLYQYHTKKISINGNLEYWNLQGVVDGISMHLTLRRIGNQKLHLYSWHYKGISPEIID